MNGKGRLYLASTNKLLYDGNWKDGLSENVYINLELNKVAKYTMFGLGFLKFITGLYQKDGGDDDSWF